MALTSRMLGFLLVLQHVASAQDYDLACDMDETSDRNSYQPFLNQPQAVVDSSLRDDKLPLKQFLTTEFAGHFHLTEGRLGLYRQTGPKEPWVYWGEALPIAPINTFQVCKWMGTLEQGLPQGWAPGTTARQPPPGPLRIAQFKDYFAEGGAIQIIPRTHLAIWHFLVGGTRIEQLLQVPLVNADPKSNNGWVTVAPGSTKDELRALWKIPAPQPLVMQDSYIDRQGPFAINVVFRYTEVQSLLHK